MRLKLLPESAGKYIDIKPGDPFARIYNERWLTIINRVPLLREPDQRHKNYYNFIFNTINCKFAHVQPEQKRITIRGTCYYASTPYSGNFSHFMAQEAASVLAARKLGILSGKIKLLAANSARFQREFWHILFPNDEIEIINIEDNKCYLVENCFYSEHNLALRWNKDIIDAFKSLAREIHIRDIPEKVYIARNDTPTRLIVNENDVVDYLARHGFHAMSFTNMALARQIAIYASAKEIISPHGANGVLLLFAGDGLRFTEMFNEYRITAIHASNLLGTEARYMGTVSKCVNNVLGIDSNYFMEMDLLGEALAHPGQVIIPDCKERGAPEPCVAEIPRYLNAAARHLLKAQDKNLPAQVRHAEFQAAVAAEPGNVGKKYLHLSFLKDNGLHEELEAQCAAYMSIAPDWGFPHVALSGLCALRGQGEQAAAQARAACQKDPLNRSYRQNLLDILKKFRLWKELEAEIAAAAKLFPDWPEADYYLSFVQDARGNGGAALASIKLALTSAKANRGKYWQLLQLSKKYGECGILASFLPEMKARFRDWHAITEAEKLIGTSSQTGCSDDREESKTEVV